MDIEIRKLIPDLAEDYVHFLILRHTMTMWMNINVIACVGVTMIMRAKTFQRQKKEEENAPYNMSKAITFKVILLIVAMRSLDGATPIRNQIA